MNETASRLAAALADRYTIERELGQGGMATVYLAQDLKHDRRVAIKVLRPELAAVLGAERFVQEIKTTAALSHPHILPLFDSGEADGFLYYVMPYLQGETIRDKLNRETQFGIEEAVRLTTEVANALDYAHRNGIIHRDIKPENILLHDGRPMVMDFGIALAVSAAAGGRITETGMSLGTPHYMSPEQATAEKDLSARSDVYSLGCVLYEMLTGNPPHVGASAQQIIMKIVTEAAAPVTTLRKSVPPNVAAALATALEKLPADRFDSAKAFAEALANPGFAGTTASAAALSAVPPFRGSAATLAFAVTTVAALGLAAWGWLRPHPVPIAPVARFTLTLPRDALLNDQPGSTIALSPDGARIVYVGRNEGGQGQLYLRGLDQLSPTPIPGTAGASQPFLSPDGLWLGFLADGKVQKVALTGGPPLTIFSADSGFAGASWSTTGTIVFATGRDLRQVPAAGGQPTVVVRLDSSDARIVWPAFLPDGKAVLFTIRGQDGTDRLAAANVTNGHLTRFEQLGSNPNYVSSGHVVLANLDGSLMVVPFDAARVAVTGAAVPLAEDVAVGSGGAAKLGVALSGALAYAVGGGGGLRSLVLVDRHGVARPLTPEQRQYGSPRLSPDGGRLAVDIGDQGGAAIWVYDLGQQTLTRLSFGNVGIRPAWTPDGRRVSYSTRAGIEWVAADGSAPAESLPGAPTGGFGDGWAPDGRTFLYHLSGNQSSDLFVLRTDSATSHPFLETSAIERAPAVSPDGHWLAYTSDESSRNEIYVRSFPTPSGKWQVSLDGGNEARWSRDGRELFYRNGDRMMAAAVHTQPTFSVGERTELFTGQFRSNPNYAQYDVTRGGQGFTMLQGAEGSSDIIVVLNWFDQIKKGGQ